jgi:hypothetical protein
LAVQEAVGAGVRGDLCGLGNRRDVLLSLNEGIAPWGCDVVVLSLDKRVAFRRIGLVEEVGGVLGGGFGDVGAGSGGGGAEGGESGDGGDGPAAVWTVLRAERWSLVRKCLPVTASSMSSAALTAEATAPVALATAVTAVATVKAMVLAVRVPTSAPMTAGRAVRAAPPVATAAMAKRMAVPMSMRRSVREKWPVVSSRVMGLVEKAW